jgi:hypothetical protein
VIKNLFFTVFISSISLCPISETFTQDKRSGDKSLRVGEEITYLVKYLFFEIGEVKLKVTDSFIENGDTIYKTIAYIDSYEGLPFVNLHQVYESQFNQHQVSRMFRGTVFGDEDTSVTKYTFDKNHNTVHIYRGRKSPPETWVDSVAILGRNHQDGLSIFYYARMRTGQNRSYNIPCFVNEKSENTIINFYSENIPIKVNSIDYEAECVKLDGKTDFVSIFGLTGEFEGWFSNDSLAIPLLAKMKVIIGNITLELIDWNKDEWMPPKYIKVNRK